MSSHDPITTQIKNLVAFFVPTTEEVPVTYDESTNTIWFSLSGKSAYSLTGRGGEALTALNHLATKIVEGGAREGVRPPRVVIDANDFEKKKIDGLKTVAHMMAERARYFKSSIDVDPMPPYDRRIVHEFLSAMPDIKTESVGEGVNRHIVVRYNGTI